MVRVGRIRGRDVEAHTPLPCPWCGKVLGRIVRTAEDRTSDLSVCVYCEGPIRYVLGENRIEVVDLDAQPAEVHAEFAGFIKMLREAKAEAQRRKQS